MVSIVIITRNTKELLRNLLLSVRTETSLIPLLEDVVLVDNGSVDGTDSMIRSEFSEVRYVQQGRNLGFAASANAGFSSLTSKYVLLLNSDTILIEGQVTRILEFMDLNKEVGICGPQLVYEDMAAQRSFADAPSILFEVVPRSLLEFLCPGRYPGKRAAFSSPLNVESIVGAAMTVRRDVLEELGGFDERFFFFLEETDLCLRVREKGHRVIFFPGATVIHLQGKTVSKKWIRGRIEYNISLYKFIEKHHGPLYTAAFASIRLFKAVLFLVAVTVVPLLFFKARIRRSYSYYLRLLAWHLRGCPDDAGLRD
jgi:N-acetylglucosaminyl-diphospho-decaprenol L-rhamnosyltransferase